ncbi:UvrB/uvrC motif [Seminavis robusta]|uniref:UvrB/uvrC motif n=1 Tax=Seminavis robusta TaxID=568900 RepID=A0A9N8HYN6_9STRA|nr:UvrB/uvrC motif [Seminavis robusta]|eukprot:Sro2034_g311990.1 UvrB/uvrC motif (211) ;mRNA; r:9834-10466
MLKRSTKKRSHQKSAQLILEANATFYSAFSTLEYDAMENLWLPDDTSICIFPSSRPLKGFSAIMKSWKHAVEAMDGNNLRNWMAPDDIQFEYLGTNKATIVCDELIFVSSSRMVQGNVFQHTDVVNKFRARNMFKKVGNRWYLCYHEAFLFQDSNPLDELGLSASSSEDSKSTFLTMMTRRTERKRDRNPFNMFLLNWNMCSPFDCGRRP